MDDGEAMTVLSKFFERVSSRDVSSLHERRKNENTSGSTVVIMFFYFVYIYHRNFSTADITRKVL